MALWQDEEEGELEFGYYYAVHEKSNKIDIIENENDFLSFFSPAGIPFSLPKTVKNINLGGALETSLSNYVKKMIAGNEILTSFELDGDIYVAKVGNNEFLGYVPLKIYEKDPEPLKDGYTLDNIDKIKYYGLQEDVNKEWIEKAKQETNNITGDYNAKGELIQKCDNCGSIFCDGTCMTYVCGHCHQNKCYCGHACICFAKIAGSEFPEECEHRRRLKEIGIPVFDKWGNYKIDYYQIDYGNTTPTNEQIVHDQKLILIGYSQYLAKLGVNSNEILDKAITNLGKATKKLEQIESDVYRKQALKKFNRVFGIYDNIKRVRTVEQMISDEKYVEAFFEAIQAIPVVNEVFDILSLMIGFVQSEAYNKALLVHTDSELRRLKGCINCDHIIEDLRELKYMAEQNLANIKRDRYKALHNQVCTCHKK
jgi:hypothetical protein